jgi:hypothetical protein
VVQTGQPYAFTADNPLNGEDPLGNMTEACTNGSCIVGSPQAISQDLQRSSAKGVSGRRAPTRTLHQRVSLAFNFFVAKGLSPTQSAGLLGNLLVESANTLDPGIKQGNCNPSILDCGVGIGQWGVDDRWRTLHSVEGVPQANTPSLYQELDFTWYELSTNPSYGLSDLEGDVTIAGATATVQDEYERPRYLSTSTSPYNSYSERVTFATEVYNNYTVGGS